MATTSKKPDAAAKAKLKRFLKKGNPEDIASVIFHTLTHSAEVAAQVHGDLVKDENAASKEQD